MAINLSVVLIPFIRTSLISSDQYTTKLKIQLEKKLEVQLNQMKKLQLDVLTASRYGIPQHHFPFQVRPLILFNRIPPFLEGSDKDRGRTHWVIN